MQATFGEWFSEKILRIPKNVSALPDGTMPPLPSIDPTKYYGGVFSDNAVKVTDNINVMLDKVAKADPKKVEAVTSAASKGGSHGFMYGIFSGTGTALRDGAVYVKDTAVEHPYITATAATAALATSAYYKFRPLTPEEEHQEKIRKTRRAAEFREASMIEATDATADEFRRCLNTHAHCGDRAENGLPRRCNSPARRLGQLNRSRAAEIAAAFKEYQ